MKVALLVFRYGPSHGSLLQTYALTRTLESLGHQVVIIDRQRPIDFISYKSLIVRVLKNALNGKVSIHDIFLDSYSSLEMKELNRFIEKELRKQTITTRSNREMLRIGKMDFDAFVVGSDQTWRPKYVYNIYDYFLDFVPKEMKCKRVAYAPSFGTSEWEYTEEQECKCRELIRRFNAISVREENGLKMCKDRFGVEATHVLDPTLLLQGKDYTKFVIPNESSYLGCNFLDFTQSKSKIASIVAEKLSLPINQLIQMGNKDIPLRKRIAPSIENWLSGIYNSEYMLVDSFHATVFCILFHKNFLTIGNRARGLARFTSLLKMVGLEDRLITEDSSFDDKLLSSKIDWKNVDDNLNINREKSIHFLLDSLV